MTAGLAAGLPLSLLLAWQPRSRPSVAGYGIPPMSLMIPILGFCNLSVFGGYSIYFPELYPTRLRSTGVGFCYNVGRIIAALGPFTLGHLTMLFSHAGFASPFRSAAISLASVYLVGVFVMPFAPETRGKPLPEE